jgi:hypothetical protein
MFHQLQETAPKHLSSVYRYHCSRIDLQNVRSRFFRSHSLVALMGNRLALKYPRFVSTTTIQIIECHRVTAKLYVGEEWKRMICDS